MNSENNIVTAYGTSVAYFSMEYAIDQSLKIYSGGLGFLAGSHMHSAHDLKQNLVSVGMLWKYGYYDQERNPDQTLKITYTEKQYNFLKDTGITVSVVVFNKTILVKAYLLEPTTFHSAPLYLLSTDLPENDYLTQTITHHLYDSNEMTRISQSIVLGIAGGKVLQALGHHIEVYHINEAHALPLAYYLYEQFQSWDNVKQHLVFTTHTPEKAGNESHGIELLKSGSFFQNAPMEEAINFGKSEYGQFDYTLAALRMARKANAVSKIHGEVSRKMWSNYTDICEITHITNAQHAGYWTDTLLLKAYQDKNEEAFKARKYDLKKILIKEVADQTGDLLSPDVLTIVWSRRFAGYKRPHLLLKQFERFINYITRENQPIQIIWAGKPYPLDLEAVKIFNELTLLSKKYARMMVLIDYELALSKTLKQGADVWLNTPRFTREASGTSGMTAAMNGTLNLSNNDGWVNEFSRPGENMFLIKHADPSAPLEEQDRIDAENLFKVIDEEVVPCYYNNPTKWQDMIFNSMNDVFANFTSDRMAKEYYEIMYNSK